MNQDIIYEILHHLYLEGYAPTAKKIQMMSKSMNLDSMRKRVEKLEKPVVFTIDGNVLNFTAKIAEGSEIYLGDYILILNIDHCVSSGRSGLIYYKKENNAIEKWKIKIFGVCEQLVFPTVLDKVYSIGSITDMNGMFGVCYGFNKPLILDTSRVTSMIGTFRNCRRFNQTLIWNTGNVENMDAMFSNCISFNQPLVWNTGNVKTMIGMFRGRISFNQPLNWNTSKVTSLAYTFQDCKSFNQSLNWDTSKVVSMHMTFYNCLSFNQYLNWNTQCVVDLESTFYGCVVFAQTLRWNLSRYVNMWQTFTDSHGSFGH